MSDKAATTHVTNPATPNLPRWKLDEYGTLLLRFIGPHGEVEAFISNRQPYCDRGHWQFGIMTGVPSLDGADSFPRYYMRLETAIEEASAWINWRLYKVPAEVPRRLCYGDPLLSHAPLVFRPAGKFDLLDEK